MTESILAKQAEKVDVVLAALVAAAETVGAKDELKYVANTPNHAHGTYFDDGHAYYGLALQENFVGQYTGEIAKSRQLFITTQHTELLKKLDPTNNLKLVELLDSASQEATIFYKLKNDVLKLLEFCPLGSAHVPEKWDFGGQTLVITKDSSGQYVGQRAAFWGVDKNRGNIDLLELEKAAIEQYLYHGILAKHVSTKDLEKYTTLEDICEAIANPDSSFIAATSFIDAAKVRVKDILAQKRDELIANIGRAIESDATTFARWEEADGKSRPTQQQRLSSARALHQALQSSEPPSTTPASI
jgi:hypothetical protein